MANGASDASTTCGLWRWFLEADGISNGPCGSQAARVITLPHPVPLHASIMESQLQQHGPQLLLGAMASSIPAIDFVTLAHVHEALILLISGCFQAFLREPLLLRGNKRLNQALRFEVIQPLPLGCIPLSLCRDLAQPVNQGHGFDGMRILWPRKSGRKGLGQKNMSRMIIEEAPHFFHLKPTKTVSFQCPPMFHWWPQTQF